VQSISSVSYLDIWGRVLALLVTAINWAEYLVCYLLAYLGKSISCVSYCDKLSRVMGVLVTGIIGAGN